MSTPCRSSGWKPRLPFGVLWGQVIGTPGPQLLQSAFSSVLAQGERQPRAPLATEGAGWSMQMQLVKAETPLLESEPCVTLHTSPALSVPRCSSPQSGNNRDSKPRGLF